MGAALSGDRGLLEKDRWSWDLNDEKRTSYKDLGNEYHKQRGKRHCDRNLMRCVPGGRSV